MSHIITNLFIKQTNYNGQRVVANDTPKHKIGKEGQNKIQDGSTKRTLFLAYWMTKHNDYKRSDYYRYGIHNGFKNEFLIKTSILKPGIYIKNFENSNDCTYKKRGKNGYEDIGIKRISCWWIDRMITQYPFFKNYMNSAEDCWDYAERKNLIK